MEKLSSNQAKDLAQTIKTSLKNGESVTSHRNTITLTLTPLKAGELQKVIDFIKMEFGITAMLQTLETGEMSVFTLNCFTDVSVSIPTYTDMGNAQFENTTECPICGAKRNTDSSTWDYSSESWVKAPLLCGHGFSLTENANQTDDASKDHWKDSVVIYKKHLLKLIRAIYWR
jgi:hypothetical protein